jgi:hypothetical protein
MVSHRRPWRGLFAIAAFGTLAGLTGCVERRYTIRTDPPGALAIVNDEEIGVTPASATFTHYGDRKITLIKDGYETRTIIQPVKAPWWDNYLTEFFTENLVPVNIRDERDFTFSLAPTKVPEQQELLSRGELLRSEGSLPPPPRRGGIAGYFGF